MDMGIRYRKICSEIDKHHYSIFGCGAIGSSAAVCLAKHNARHFYLYDNDTVSPENIGISMFREFDIGESKVESLKEILEIGGTNSKIQVQPHKEWLDQDSAFTSYKDGLNIGILCFDNMYSRKEIAGICFRDKFNYIIDARMGREQIQLYTVKNIKTYEKYWYPDFQASSDTCEEKGTPDVSMISGSLITSQIRKIVNKQPYPEEVCFHIPSMALECNTMVK
jgi:molybdopterin/thiamine biosynthesis adenylyltransferase